MLRLVLFTIAFALAAPTAHAEELRFFWSFQSDYDQESVDEQDDWTFSFEPRVRLSGDRPRLTYSIEHGSRYSMHTNASELDGFRHSTNVTGAWMIDNGVTLNVSNRFSVTPRLSTRDPEDFNVGEDVDEDRTQNDVRTNVFNATLRVRPFARLTGSLGVSHFYRQFDDPTFRQQDTDSLSTTSSLSWRHSERHTFGAGFTFRRRNFSTAAVNDSNTDTYNAFATWSWRIDSRTTFSARAGPAWSTDTFGDVDFPRFATVPGSPSFLADPNTCSRPIMTSLGIVALLNGSCNAVAGQGQLTSGQASTNAGLSPIFFPGLLSEIVTEIDQGGLKEETNIDAFFSFGLTRVWNRVQSGLSWSRSDSQTQSLGAATTLDTLSLTTRWDPTERLSGLLSFRWTRRESDSQQELEFPVFGPLVFTDDLGGGTLMAAPIIGSAKDDNTLNALDDIVTLSLRVSRDVGRRTTFFVSTLARWSERQFETDFLDDRSKSNDWEVRFGFNYSFKPIRL